MLHGVIFDIDGTLVDSNNAHAQSWADTFAEAGYEVLFDVVRPLIGMGADKLLPKTTGVRHDSGNGKKLWHAGRRSSTKLFPRLKRLPGFRRKMHRVPADLLAHYNASPLGGKSQ